MQKALREDADYVVFNGSVGSLVGDNALQAKTGERVRLYVGNGGPNLVSSFHVIGEIFDKVYVEGGKLINRNVQTTIVPAGGTAIVEMEMQVPGKNILVDHSIFRAFNKGALGMIDVSADTAVYPEKLSKKVYSGQIADEIYLPEGGVVLDLQEKIEPKLAMSPVEQIEFGKKTFQQVCAACHQTEGGGIANAFPPLAGSDWLVANDKEKVIKVIVNGLSGPITVNDANYNGSMPAMSLTDEEVANVLTFVYSSWNNSGDKVSVEDVAKARSAH